MASPQGGKVYQVPLSYRGSELPGAGDSLLGTVAHSVLGKRWVYDACADSVYVTALATAILTGQREAKQFVEVGTEDNVTRIDAGGLTLLVTRVLDLGTQGSEDSTLKGKPTPRGTWSDQSSPVLLASLALA